ncbi:hypothetical protein [Desulfosporosinus sp. Sb-LF]|uniref:hypothetical protein n=1 Tax=Desulfosporosinus sp. Sb-LF TaxID=2560027 RepID=UPI00107EEAB9|nr:hypothetical protein [Desulfosporosinus sp. Sb-LF]TGE33195.1 hypothetical protein E4K68_06720 [Desulfosporosinus sp. Sb-LF]
MRSGCLANLSVCPSVLTLLITMLPGTPGGFEGMLADWVSTRIGKTSYEVGLVFLKKSVENKVFENSTIDGYTVVAIDRTKFFGSNKKSCPKCLKNSKGERTHCFHSGAVMSTVGIGPKLVFGF